TINSLTGNFVPKWNASNFAFQNSSIFDTGTAVGIGTTTPYFGLTIASSTGSQLVLTDATNTQFGYALRSVNGSFFLATSTYNATSSVAALSINGTTGAFTFNSGATSTFSSGLQTTGLNVTGTIASSTFGNGINLNTGCFSINGTCLSASAVSLG